MEGWEDGGRTAQTDSGGRDKENWLGEEGGERGEKETGG